MKEALTKALVQNLDDDASVDRIMATSFFRSRPTPTGASAQVIRLEDRRVNGASGRS